MIVTGPSLINETSIIAPNIPVFTLTFSFLIFSLSSSYNFFACSGLAALIKLGRLPLLVSPYKVKCVFLGTRMQHIMSFKS